MKRINDSLIEKIQLVCIIPFYLRYDVLPFFVIYVILFSVAQIQASKPTSSNPYGNVNMFAMIAIPCTLFIQLVLFLVSQWSVKLCRMIGYTNTTDIMKATHVHVCAAKNAGADRIVRMVHTAHTNTSGTEFYLDSFRFQIWFSYFEFQKVRYSFDSDKKIFVRLDYMASGTVSDFLNLTGHNTKSYKLGYFKWGQNEFEIPVPAFLDLYVEHLVAPFFVFQVVCLVLWSLDDYWYYSLMTLVMLLVFEGMLCNQRLTSLQMLRAMRREDVVVHVYRDGSWTECMSNKLVPGDILSLASLQRRAHDRLSEKNDDRESVMPCDALLIRGQCVMNEAMLTGESVPQMKDSLKTFPDVSKHIELGSESSVDENWKRFMVFGGTTMLQNKEGMMDKDDKIPNSPGSGAVALVVRTGFGTSQGAMMRKILYAKEKINANSYETFYFIGVLIIFAVGASVLVLKNGLEDPSRNKFKLVLHCIMIITSVVPPELPMELSLAVTNSLAALQKNLVYCTEPFRIASAGKLDVLCFDKTGTLTKDKMYLKGVVSPHLEDAEPSSNITADSAADGNILDVQQASPLVLSIMGSCHSLFVAGGKVCGDPLEVVTMEATGYSIDYDGSIVMPGGDGKISIVQKYPFSSALKRMSVLIDSPVHGWKLFMKGAPEIISSLLISVPQNYVSTYTYHMSKGKRVLALAYRDIQKGISLKTKREDLEKKLHFAGFLVFDCDLKPDSRSVMKELVASEHKVVMITGDSPYTACEVARRLGMFTFPSYSPTNDEKKQKILMLSYDNDQLMWSRIDVHVSKGGETIVFDSSSSALSLLYQQYRLCVTGSALQWIKHIYNSGEVTTQSGCKIPQQSWRICLRELTPYVTVFARVSPSQKEEIILSFNDTKLITLMTGDGTNDVGALKAAHVGVSIVNDPDFENRIDGNKGTKKSTKKASAVNAKERMDRALAELREQEADPTIIKLGDASIASPFTSRRTSIDAILTVIRQGRATLVTTVQIYKILALNCLVSAYMMSALYLKGLKQGDIQMTASGLVTAALFFFLSQAKPLLRISEKRPAKSVFSKAVIMSIVGQFFVHLMSLLCALKLCEVYSPVQEDSVLLSPDGRFQPNLVNSAVFLLSSVIQINNFVVNYRGAPFTQNIQDNTTLWRSVQVLYGAVAVAASGILEPLNDLLQLAPFPSENPEFKSYLMLLLVINFGVAYTVEYLCRKVE